VACAALQHRGRANRPRWTGRLRVPLRNQPGRDYTPTPQQGDLVIGYTHYTYRNKAFTQDQWEKICLETLDIIVKHCDRKKITLAWEYDSPSERQPTLFGGAKWGPKPPQVDNDVIRFNGWKEKGHETFMVTRELGGHKTESGELFDFCKTARKPYDMAVMLVLLSMRRHAPDSVRISSDGDWDDEWVPAREAYKNLFGVEVDCPFEPAEA